MAGSGSGLADTPDDGMDPPRISGFDYRKEPANPMRGRLACLTLIGLLGLDCHPALSQSHTEICVRCAQPDQTYRCAIPAEDRGFSDVTRRQLQCVTQIARSYGHASCSVRTAGTGPCEGILEILAGNGAATAPISRQPAQQGGPTQPSLAETAPAQSSASPSQQAPGGAPSVLEKTGKAIEGAARDTWTCVTSMFTRCP